ncbi:BTB/POZ domain-containing protein At3g22104 isoform X2 [Rhodamnia argentea]|nr:BTB/POZ domain-containing protein At3g22104 isoform X2 [Rhodamnia argentea]XP_048137817.1 BTB/POZ domain-containing protein At3g22104 isoform X2 [Rhodamnia argentea]
MEMSNSISGHSNLIEQTEKSLEEIRHWTWSELMVALRQCQNSFPVASKSGLLERCLDSVTTRLALASERSPSPSTSSSDYSGVRFSCETKSTESLKSSFSRANWWFEDLLVIDVSLLVMMVGSMIKQKVEHAAISKFLFFYQKSKFHTAMSHEKCKIMETVVDLLHSLEPSSVPCKSLFGILRVALGLNISKGSRNKLEIMIASQIDQATLDNLLVPSPQGTNSLYDTNLVVRLVKAFLKEGTSGVPEVQLKKVANLMDLYIAEVAPDPYLKPSKFLALATVLPDSARDSFDCMYHAVDMYMEVHAGLSEEEKIKICRALNYRKLSAEACKHLSENSNFPSKIIMQALNSQEFRLKSLIRVSSNTSAFTSSPCSFSGNIKKDEAGEQIVLYAGDLDLSTDNVRLRAQLQGMQSRVTELEKLCRKMQTQMAKVLRSRVSSSHRSRSLPRLCS